MPAMNLTHKLQAEIRRVMDDYWARYFHGDLDAWLQYLPDDYRNIGSTEEEIWNSKEEILTYSRTVIDQMAGNVDLRNKQVQIIPYEPYFMVHELGDLFIRTGDDWAFYAKFRLSSLIQPTDDGWKVLHQHGSFPDAKAQEGESIGFEKISRENQELREAVKRRTIELEHKNRELEAALTELRATQAQLIQKEKLASLGELTAGIAHEIQNPLNFVNNFAEVSAELVGELRGEATSAERDPGLTNELLEDLSKNLEKITHHGHRASRIVKGMLDHSRTSTGERHPTALNALTSEYLHLSYRGWVANHPRFTCEVVTQFDSELNTVDIVPPEIGRVLLNLFNNAFYAVAKRTEGAGTEYQPTVWVGTKREPQAVEIRVRDNGTGISEAVMGKIFQPFFTTKPTGEGTGLGLSLSYDIITKGHGGTLTVSHSQNQGTEFLICLPT